MGYIGAILLALCAAPQAYKSYKEGVTQGFSSLFLLMWWFGEIIMLVYVAPTLDIPLLLNYGLNTVLVAVILKYKYFPR